MKRIDLADGLYLFLVFLCLPLGMMLTNYVASSPRNFITEQIVAIGWDAFSAGRGNLNEIIAAGCFFLPFGFFTYLYFDILRKMILGTRFGPLRGENLRTEDESGTNTKLASWAFGILIGLISLILIGIFLFICICFGVGRPHYKERAVYNKTLKLDSGSLDSIVQQGIVFSKKGNHGQAITYFTKALKRVTQNKVLYALRAAEYKNSGNYYLAIADYSKALELDPEYIAAYLQRGMIYDEKGEQDRAIADYSKAIELKPESVLLYEKRGYAYCASEKIDLAIADFFKVIKFRPQSPESYYMLAVCYFQKNEFEMSWIDLHKAQEMGYIAPAGFIYDLKKASGREN